MSNSYKIENPSQIQNPKFIFGLILQAAFANPLLFALEPEDIVSELASILELCKRAGFEPTKVPYPAEAQLLRHALTNSEFMESVAYTSMELPEGEAEGLRSILNAIKLAA